MDRFQERTERRTGKGLYSCVHACPCLFFKMALVEKSGFSGAEDSRKKGAAGTGRTAGRRKEWECIALSDFQRRRTQFGRRNLSAYDRSILALKLKPIIEAKAKKNLVTHTKEGYQGLQISAKADNEENRVVRNLTRLMLL